MFLRKLFLFTLVLSCFLCCQKSSAQDVYVDFVNDTENHPYDYKMWDRYGKYQQKVNEVAFKLLNKNKFPRRARFIVDQKNGSKQVINASARYFDGRIKIWKGMLLFADTDDELAAVLAHELGHFEQLSTGNWLLRRLGMFSFPKRYEYDADEKGIDYMVKAGYNPLAMISMFNKITHEKSTFAKVIYFLAEISYFYLLPIDTHPTGSKRLLNQYNYIQEKYSRFLVNTPDNIYYVNFLMNSENNDHIKLLKNKHKVSPVDMGENL